MKKLIIFILIATFTITTGCQSDKNGDTKMSADERQNAAGEQKVTRENWQPQPPTKTQMDSLRKKAQENKGKTANMSGMTNEQITHSANSYADMYCRCQNLPTEAKQPTSINPRVEKPKFIETKGICISAVTRSTQKISDGLKDAAAKQKLFLDTYKESIKNCK